VSPARQVVWLTPAEYARHRRVSRQAVHKAIAQGRVQLFGGRIDRDAADREWIDNTDPIPGGSSTPGAVGPPAATGEDLAAAPSTGGPSFHRARTVWQGYRAQLARLEYEVRVGKLVNADEVRQAAYDHGRRLRDALIGLPARVAAELAAARKRAECERILLREIHRLCEELADGKLWPPAPPPA